MPNYNWTRVQYPNGGYGYVKTDNNDQAIEYKRDGTFKVYSQPDEKSHSFYTSFETRPRTIQRAPDDHEAHLAQQRQVDEKVRQVTPSAGQLFNVATVGGLNNLSPTQWMRRAYDTGQLIQGYMPLNEYMNKLYYGNNGIVSDEYARKHPYRAMAANLAGDIATFGAASTLRPVKVVSPQQTVQVKQFIHPAEVVRTGRQYVRPSVQKGMVSEPLMDSKSDLRAAITPEDLTNRKFFSVEEYGPEPVYTRETVPKKIELRRDWEADPLDDNANLDITYMDYNFDHSKPMSPMNVLKNMSERFNKSAHGRGVGFDEHEALSTDSYPLALAQFQRLHNKGLGTFFIPQQLERTPKILLNKAGNRPISQETVDWLNAKINSSGFTIPKAELVTVNGKQRIAVSPIGLFKHKNGAKITPKS